MWWAEAAKQSSCKTQTWKKTYGQNTNSILSRLFIFMYTDSGRTGRATMRKEVKAKTWEHIYLQVFKKQKWNLNLKCYVRYVRRFSYFPASLWPRCLPSFLFPNNCKNIYIIFLLFSRQIILQLFSSSSERLRGAGIGTIT